jgi:uncharacterized protein YyaL (SSP411 family)
MQGERSADRPQAETGSGAGNALGAELSAYLRQHAGNPVHWRPFGDDAFAAAARRDVPVFLSIGYAACHWCHVMARESFEDEETAAFLNQHFVPVKVDREERPDVDAVYMAATQAISGEGGWPMSVFLTPQGRAFHAGTYYPPRPMPGRPSFRQVLEAVHAAWTERRDAVEQNAESLAHGLGQAASAAVVELSGPPATIDSGLLATAVRALGSSEDPAGGFGSAPKFPPSSVLEFLIRHAAVPSETAQAAKDMAGRTLAAMSRSALFDQLDGGFARYSVTQDWSVPHFEKMLYDNAQLLRVYAHWLRLEGPSPSQAGSPYPAAEAADVAERTATWMISSLGMGSVDGHQSLASSLDADTVIDGEHHEGASYLWTTAELRELLGAGDGAAVARMMNVHSGGTVTADASPLHPGRALEPEEAALWQRVRPVLLEARSSRPQPARDEKVVAGWNGLSVAALAEAGAVLGRPDFVEAAQRIATYLERVHWKPGQDGSGTLTRASHAGKARGIGGLLEDYAFCADGLFSLYAVTGNVRWFGLAEAILTSAEVHFTVDGTLVDTMAESEQVFNAQGRRQGLDPFDNAAPSGTAAFAGALLSYSALTGSLAHRKKAGRILSLVEPLAPRAPRAAGWLLATAQAELAGPVEAAVVGPPSPERDALHKALLLSPSPGLVIAVGADAGGYDAAAHNVAVPLLHGRTSRPDAAPQVYLCRGMVCERPVATVPELLDRLAGMTR